MLIPRKQILFYIAALVAPALALVARVALERRYGELPPYLLGYPLVLVVAIWGGVWAGLLATAASALMIAYWVIPPRGQFGFERTADAVGLAVFCVMGVGISVFAEFYRRNRQRLETYSKQQGLQEAQRAERQRFLAVLDTLPAMICLLTPDYHVAFANRSFRERFGESRGRHCYEYCFGRAEPCDFCESYDVLKTGQPHHWEVKGEDGSVISAWDVPFTDVDGSPLILEMDLDITERKRAEEALRQSEERFRAMVTASSDVMYRMSPDWSEMRQLRSPTFLANTEAPSRGWLEKYIHPDDQARVMEVIHDAIRTKGIFELEHRVIRADGSLGWTFSRAVPLLDANGEILEWFGAASDITERKKVEKVLQRSEQRLRLAQQIAQVGAFDWDIRTGVQEWTPELEALYGLSPGSFGGTQAEWENLLHPEDRDETVRRVAASLETGAITQGEWRVIWPDGSIHWLAGRWQVTKDEAGNPAHMTGYNIDITKRKLAEPALIRSEKLASVGRMAATLAHEVNNPLAGAVNAVYLASIDPTASPSIRKTLTLADQELQRAAHITQQTLAFYRENGKRTPVALPKLIDEVLRVYARKLQERGIDVRIRLNCGPCREGCETCFIVNSGEMRQVISNLLGNGMDALRDNGRLYIRVSRMTSHDGSGQDIHLTIADNGCGIRTENLQRIFEPFFTTKESVGTGLGLWITQQLVRNHNGTIRVRSSKDRGTVFRVSIPAVKATDSGPHRGRAEILVTNIAPAANCRYIQ